MTKYPFWELLFAPLLSCVCFQHMLVNAFILTGQPIAVWYIINVRQGDGWIKVKGKVGCEQVSSCLLLGSVHFDPSQTTPLQSCFKFLSLKNLCFICGYLTFVIDSNHFWPDWSLLLTKSTWCSTPPRWPWPRTSVSRGSAKTRRTVNALTRIEPDLVPLWTNLDRAELYQLY